MVVFVLPVLCFRVIEVIKTYLSPSHSHSGPTQHSKSLMDMPRNHTEYHLLVKWTASLRQFSSESRRYGPSVRRQADYKQSSCSELSTL